LIILTQDAGWYITVVHKSQYPLASCLIYSQP